MYLVYQAYLVVVVEGVQDHTQTGELVLVAKNRTGLRAFLSEPNGHTCDINISTANVPKRGAYRQLPNEQVSRDWAKHEVQSKPTSQSSCWAVSALELIAR